MAIFIVALLEGPDKDSGFLGDPLPDEV